MESKYENFYDFDSASFSNSNNSDDFQAFDHCILLDQEYWHTKK